jgi:hypothetical protein
MDVNRSNVENVDEAWILKYRAALKNVPAEAPRFAKILDMIRTLRTSFVLHTHQMLWKGEKPEPAGEPKAVASIPLRESKPELKAS